MRKADSQDEVDPDGAGPKLKKPRRHVPGNIKNKSTLARNQPRAVDGQPELVALPEDEIDDTKVTDHNTADERFVWQQEMTIWEIDHKDQNKKKTACDELCTNIQETIDQKYIELTFDKENVFEMLVAL